MEEFEFSTKVFGGNLQQGLGEFLKKGILILYGDVDIDMYKHVLNSLSRLELSGSPDIIIKINSDGGAYSYGLRIYDLIRLYKGKTIGMVVGHSSSMAFVILQACSIRIASKHSSLLAHYGTSKMLMNGTFDEKILNKFVEDNRLMANMVLDIFLLRATASKEEVHQLIIDDVYILAEKAKSYGLIDEII